MQRLLFALAAVLTFFFAFTATLFADDVNLSWTLPTERVDGTALAPSEITSVKIYYSAGSGGPYSLLATLSGDATTYLDPNRSPGLHCYVATATALSTDGTSDLESGFSDEACKRVLAAPKPPGNLSAS